MKKLLVYRIEVKVDPHNTEANKPSAMLSDLGKYGKAEIVGSKMVKAE